nr:expressed protein [Hymenolepis microstoma]
MKFQNFAPTREERMACWQARDAFWACIKDAYPDLTQVPDEPEETLKVPKCQSLRKTYEDLCPGAWIRLFDRQNDEKLFGVWETTERLKYFQRR